MPPFRLQVRDDATWRATDHFQDRHSALEKAEQMKKLPSCTGIKVLEEVIDEHTLAPRQKVVFAWTTQTLTEKKNEFVDGYMGRRKDARTEKEHREELERQLKTAKIKNFVLSSALFLGCLLIAAGLIYLKTK